MTISGKKRFLPDLGRDANKMRPDDDRLNLFQSRFLCCLSFFASSFGLFSLFYLIYFLDVYATNGIDEVITWVDIVPRTSYFRKDLSTFVCEMYLIFMVILLDS